MTEKPICIREVNENLRRIKLNEPLTRSLVELQTHCEFKRKYKEWCDIQDGIEHYDLKRLNCVECGKKFKQRIYKQICCSKKCSNIHKKKWREANKDKIAERRKAYYEANKDKIAERVKAYREANKDKIAERVKAWREANKDKIKAYREANKDTRTKQERMRDAWERAQG